MKEDIKKVAKVNGYIYYVGTNNKGKKWYNVIPENQPPPGGGYLSSSFICHIKNVPNLF